MLARDEFDQRVGQTFAVRTYIYLATLTADLPAGLRIKGRSKWPPQPAKKKKKKKKRVPSQGRAAPVDHPHPDQNVRFGPYITVRGEVC